MPLIKVGDVAKKSYDALPEGRYEVFVDKFDEPTNVDGVEVSRIMFTVRTDLDGDFKNRKLFTNIKSSDNFAWMINGLSKAVGIPVNSAYETLGEFLADIKGKPLVVKVKHKPNPKNPTDPYVNITDFYPTEHKTIKADGADSEII